MTFIKRTIKPIVFSALSVLGGITLGATLVGAVTTISTNITTAGTFNADDAATFGSTVAVTGSTTLASLLNIGGAANLNSTLNVVGSSTVQALNVGGAGMLSSTTATSLKVGQTGTRHTGILSGYCTIAASGHTASTTKQFTCASATGVTTSDRVFVQATSSMPGMFIVQAATSSTGAIEVAILNTGLGTTTDGGLVGPTSLNFWAVR